MVGVEEAVVVRVRQLRVREEVLTRVAGERDEREAEERREDQHGNAVEDAPNDVGEHEVSLFPDDERAFAARAPIWGRGPRRTVGAASAPRGGCYDFQCQSSMFQVAPT